MNLVICDWIVLAAMMDGVNMSLNPTIIVLEAAKLSGTFRKFNSGKNGLPKISKTCVLFASTSDAVPIIITIGITENHIPNAFSIPFFKNSPIPL